MTDTEKAVVRAIKDYAALNGAAIEYVPDLDILGIVKDLIEQAPLSFPLSRYPR